MAYLALNGTNPQANVQNNLKNMWVEYEPATPVQVPLGQEFDIAQLFPGNPTLQLKFKTKKGTFDVANGIPLSVFACLYGLKGDKAGYIEANNNQSSILISTTGLTIKTPETVIPSTGLVLDATPPTTVDVGGNATFPETENTIEGDLETGAFAIVQNVTKISFAIDVFKICRLFDGGDLMQVIIQGMPVGAIVKIYISDAPYASKTSLPYQYRTQTVLANNDLQVNFKGKLIFPNDPAKVDQLQFSGNNWVQWDLVDFYANANSDWVTNKTTYNSSPFIFLDTKSEMVENVRFKAGATGFDFYYMDEY